MLLTTKAFFVLVTLTSVVFAQGTIGDCVQACIQFANGVACTGAKSSDPLCICDSENFGIFYSQCLNVDCGAIGVAIGPDILAQKCASRTASVILEAIDWMSRKRRKANAEKGSCMMNTDNEYTRCSESARKM
ncbi:hypothetical protein BD410DRAFT_885955 [Rickenella mellea]|uniref:Extracellular membrane protein CFEM domain-containing protein n=1 Tax=Rickenella mellea TaxID=50990 RepID=A0A4Y7PP14_9AGAM|nr:hypothetical protein BD410DRAFT_885955 [Rickenella mellea]